MRVLFDSEIFDRQRAGGISRYFAELIATFRRERLARVWLPFLLTENVHLAEKRLASVWSVDEVSWKYKEWCKQRINRALTEWPLKRGWPQVFHKTYYDLALLEHLRAPLVVTVYDMIPELFPAYFDQAAVIHPNKRELCARADAVLCISENTKTDLVRLFGVDPSKIAVTHLGIDPGWAARTSSVQLPASFLLFVGERRGYKNFDQLLGAFARLAAGHPELHLVCVGNTPWSADERAQIEALGLVHRLHRRAMTDSELAYCYSKAKALIFPSLYEGFGLPTLEAFVCGCPVILSNRSCFPEIADEAALYFDPTAPESLDAAIERLLRDGTARRRLVELGRRRAANFPSYGTAHETLKMYRRVV